MNVEIIKRIVSDYHKDDYTAYKNMDFIHECSQRHLYTTEVLNKLEVLGLLAYVINLKIGKLIMLMRNLLMFSGLCNGTLVVT